MTTNGNPVNPSNSTQAPPNGTQPPQWAVPAYQPTWQQSPATPPQPTKVQPSGSLALLWVITVLSGVLGIADQVNNKGAAGAGLIGFCGASLLVTLAVQALRHR